MLKNLIDSIQSLFASPEKRLEIRTRELAIQTTKDFNNLQKIIKDSEYAMADHQKVVNNRDQFLSDNSEIQIGQNVSINEDNKRTKYILWVVVSIASILSIKGLRFFLSEFYATVNMLFVLPLAFFLAFFIVHGSIYINNFSTQYKSSNSFIFYQIKAFAYGMVLFIPAMNLLEGFNSNYRPVVMALNIIGCVIDVILHTSLVSMSNVFKIAEDSKKAIKTMRLIDKDLVTADLKLRAFNDVFIKAKTAFTNSAKQFLSSFKEFQIRNAEAASIVLLQLDNFTIWMINNRVMQHAVLPYHSDENGHPIVELTFFSREQDSIRAGWDLLSTIKVNNTNNQQIETFDGQRQVNALSSGDDAGQPQREQTNFEGTTGQETVTEELTHPEDYDVMLDSVNQNDKIL